MASAVDCLCRELFNKEHEINRDGPWTLSARDCRFSHSEDRSEFLPPTQFLSYTVPGWKYRLATYTVDENRHHINVYTVPAPTFSGVFQKSGPRWLSQPGSPTLIAGPRYIMHSSPLGNSARATAGCRRFQHGELSDSRTRYSYSATGTLSLLVNVVADKSTFLLTLPLVISHDGTKHEYDLTELPRLNPLNQERSNAQTQFDVVHKTHARRGEGGMELEEEMFGVIFALPPPNPHEVRPRTPAEVGAGQTVVTPPVSRGPQGVPAEMAGLWF